MLCFKGFNAFIAVIEGSDDVTTHIIDIWKVYHIKTKIAKLAERDDRGTAGRSNLRSATRIAQDSAERFNPAQGTIKVSMPASPPTKHRKGNDLIILSGAYVFLSTAGIHR